MLFSDFGLFSLPLRLSEAELSACAKVVLPEEAEHLGKLSFAQAAALRVEAAALCSRLHSIPVAHSGSPWRSFASC